MNATRRGSVGERRHRNRRVCKFGCCMMSVGFTKSRFNYMLPRAKREFWHYLSIRGDSRWITNQQPLHQLKQSKSNTNIYNQASPNLNREFCNYQRRIYCRVLSPRDTDEQTVGDQYDTGTFELNQGGDDTSGELEAGDRSEDESSIFLTPEEIAAANAAIERLRQTEDSSDKNPTSTSASPSSTKANELQNVDTEDKLLLETYEEEGNFKQSTVLNATNSFVMNNVGPVSRIIFGENIWGPYVLCSMVLAASCTGLILALDKDGTLRKTVMGAKEETIHENAEDSDSVMNKIMWVPVVRQIVRYVQSQRWRREANERLQFLGSQLAEGYISVDLSGLNLGDEGASYLAENLSFSQDLEMVDFSGNGIGADGVQALAQGIAGNMNLHTLSLSGNQFGDEGVVVLAEVLKTDNRGIQTLNLSSTGMADDGAKALAEALKQNSALTSLTLDNNMIDYEGASALAEAIADNKSLVRLSINGNYVGALGAGALGRALQRNDSLTELLINGNDVGDTGVQCLCDGLEQHGGQIKRLDVGKNSLGLEGAKSVAKLLSTNSNLETLIVSMNDMGDKGAELLAAGLEKNTALVSLDINGNNIKANGCQKILNAILGDGGVEGGKKISKLRALDLGYNPIGPDGAKIVANSFKFDEVLEDLRLGWCHVGNKEGAEAIADIIRYNTSIKKMDLRGNTLGDKGVETIARTLRVVNDSLTDLNLGFNEIKDKGVYSFAKMLKEGGGGGGLKEVNLSNNYVTKLGEAAISEAVDTAFELYNREVAVYY